MILNDIEPPKLRVCDVIFLRFFLRCGAHSRVNCAEMAGEIPRQPVYKIAALNLDFSTLHFGLLISRSFPWESNSGTP